MYDNSDCLLTSRIGKNFKLLCEQETRLCILKTWMKREKQLQSPAATGIWGQIHPVCWRLWSYASDDFDPLCLAKWNQYVNLRRPATSDVLPMKHHPAHGLSWLMLMTIIQSGLNFPSGRVTNVTNRDISEMFWFLLCSCIWKQWTRNWLLHQWGLKSATCS